MKTDTDIRHEGCSIVFTDAVKFSVTRPVFD